MSRLVSGLSFEASVAKYEFLMIVWGILVHSFPGWNLSEVQKLTPRERSNWLEIATQYQKVQRK